ncbi:MAG: bacillithiol biosynthesis cysteine-adding enzyme BshC [Candidatus Acidiferrales bacterium]
MDPHCIPFTEIPHTSKLSADYLYGFERVEKFFAHNSSDSSAFRRAAQEIRREASRCRAVADVLAEQNQRWGGGAEVERNIARLGEGKVVAVVTGQQVGLFGGPAYSVYKALTAVRLAEKLTSEGTPAVPVFWMATEDHDFAEVNHCLLLDAQEQLLSLRDDSPHEDDAPVGRIAFGSSIEALRAQAARAWTAEVRDEAESLLAGYTPGATYADAFARLLARLFAGHGLVILDPTHPKLHELSQPVFRRALEEAESLHAAVRARDRELEKAGYHAQVHLRDNATLLFVMVNGRRVPLRRRGGGFHLAGQGEQSLGELLGALESAPERFSANVLLRPIQQDWLLPTAAYVAGPHEATYFAQASVLYERLLGRMPVIVPRVSLTLVPPKVQRLLRKYKLGVTDCWRAPEQVRLRVAAQRLPRSLARQLERTQAKLEKELAETAERVKALDPTLAGAAETSRRKMLYQFEKLRRKAARAQAEREETVGRHTDLLCNWLHPERDLQERRLSFLTFAAQFGQPLVERLLGEIRHPCPDHQVILL